MRAIVIPEFDLDVCKVSTALVLDFYVAKLEILDWGVVPQNIDASDLRQVFWSLTTRVHAERDVVKIPNTRIWSLDNVSDIVPGMSAMYRLGTKWLIDATKPAVTQGKDRARFDRAMPFNYDNVDLREFLP